MRRTDCHRTPVASSGQRNSLGERLRWCHPAECLSRPRVERSGDGVKLTLRALGEVRGLEKVLAQQPVGVLVAAALSWAFGIAEVDLHSGVDCELDVLGHLL